MSNIRFDSTEQLPSIVIARQDHARLERLADDAVKERHPVGKFLMSEIRRAVVFDTHQVPDGTVRLNERVTYRVDGGRQPESKILVCPHDLRNGLMELSVLSPLGAALLGMSVGQRMKFFSLEGGLHSVIVESVLAPAGAPVLFPVQSRRSARRTSTNSPGPDDDGPQAA
ncbi:MULTISPECIES: GreA/GreB family elongation factor [Bradyrhizobium]|uniref:GreA/GreB family elongation factor n=1 Tax=Bradyrhizobium TaxID=374 RepID=UPI00195AF895|nr:GreA/GreB family elongation factor [Bradyrhizobium canariense]MBM7486054.1 regulator of nucleoside diphosphate kinase [Bradyrhizobium canariense]UFW72917.1 GreA/GreB family elongation factor [Bradyrhizobium canariense]